MNCGWGLSARLDGVLTSAQAQGSNTTYEVKVSFLEIYNEKVQDLLVKKREDLRIVHDPLRCPCVSAHVCGRRPTWLIFHGRKRLNDGPGAK